MNPKRTEISIFVQSGAQRLLKVKIRKSIKFGRKVRKICHITPKPHVQAYHLDISLDNWNRHRKPICRQIVEDMGIFSGINSSIWKKWPKFTLLPPKNCAFRHITTLFHPKELSITLNRWNTHCRVFWLVKITWGSSEWEIS